MLLSSTLQFSLNFSPLNVIHPIQTWPINCSDVVKPTSNGHIYTFIATSSIHLNLVGWCGIQHWPNNPHSWTYQWKFHQVKQTGCKWHNNFVPESGRLSHNNNTTISQWSTEHVSSMMKICFLWILLIHGVWPYKSIISSGTLHCWVLWLFVKVSVIVKLKGLDWRDLIFGNATGVWEKSSGRASRNRVRKVT